MGKWAIFSFLFVLVANVLYFSITKPSINISTPVIRCIENVKFIEVDDFMGKRITQIFKEKDGKLVPDVCDNNDTKYNGEKYKYIGEIKD